MYTLKELKSLPTLSVGQAEDLKIEWGNIRIWLSRCKKEDGEPYNNKVTVEQYIEGRWVTVREYKASLGGIFKLGEVIDYV